MLLVFVLCFFNKIVFSFFYMFIAAVCGSKHKLQQKTTALFVTSSLGLWEAGTIKPTLYQCLHSHCLAINYIKPHPYCNDFLSSLSYLLIWSSQISPKHFFEIKGRVKMRSRRSGRWSHGVRKIFFLWKKKSKKILVNAKPCIYFYICYYRVSLLKLRNIGKWLKYFIFYIKCIYNIIWIQP